MANVKKELVAAREQIKREQLREHDQQIETLQTRLREVIRLGFDIFADEFPGRSSCGSVSPHGPLLSPSTGIKNTDPASTSASPPLAKYNILNLDMDPRQTKFESSEVQSDKEALPLKDPAVYGFDITTLIGEYEPDPDNEPKSGAWLKKDGRWMAYDVKNQDLYDSESAQSGSGQDKDGYRYRTREVFMPSKKARYSMEGRR